MQKDFTRLDRLGGWGFRHFRARPWLCVGLVYAALAAIVTAERVLPRPWGPLGAILVITAGLGVGFLAFRRMRARLVELEVAFDEGDGDTVMRIRTLVRIDPAPTPKMAHEELVGEGELLLRLERWIEARETLERVDRSRVLAVARPGVLSEIGYAIAHAGDPARGVEIIDGAMAEAGSQRDYPSYKLWFLRVRRGIALSLADRHEEALAELTGALDAGDGAPHDWTAAMFFMARSLRAIGEQEAASHALGRTASDGVGRWAARAKAMALRAASAPHRADGVWRERDVTVEDQAEDEDEAEDEDAEDEDEPGQLRQKRNM